MRKALMTILFIFLILVILLYSGVVFVLPKLVNSDKFVSYIENMALEKFNTKIKADGLILNISPLFNIKFKVKNLVVLTPSKETALKLSDFDSMYDIKNPSSNQVQAKLIQINIDEVIKVLPERKKKTSTKTNFNLNDLPDVKIDKITISKSINPKLNASFSNFEIKSNKNKKIINLVGNAKVDRILLPLTIGNSGAIFVQDDKLWAENYTISIGEKIHFLLNGTILEKGKLGTLNLNAKNIPVSDTMKILLYLQKFTDPTKKFIENFKNYRGIGYIDLNYKNKELEGYAKLSDVEAQTVLFGLPLKVNNAEFFIKNNEVNSFVAGVADNQKITHKLHMINIMSKNRIAYGEVRTKITKQMVDKYLPKDFSLKNHIDLNIDYKIQNRKVTVKYNGYLPKSTYIKFRHYTAGIPNKERLIKAETYKDGTNLYLKNYNYSYKEDNKYKEILHGEGFFLNENGKMFPQYITCITDGFVPNSFAGSFGNYVIGGKFNGELKYIIPKKQIIGKFEVINTIFNKFMVKSAKVIGDEKSLKVLANGTYKEEVFTCKGDAKNDFRGKIYVNNMDLFLDKFIIKKSNENDTEKKEFNIDETGKKISSSAKKISMDVEKWQIRGNTIKIRNIQVNDILLQGSIKNSVLKYSIPKLLYANGIITASGTYDFNKDISIIDFSVNNIDSNTIATEFFDLPNQIEGQAKATLHSQTHKDLKDWHAFATFEMDNGSLPQIENFEFAQSKLNPKHKMKISDFVKVNATKKGNIQSKLVGSFQADDRTLYDVDIRLQHEFLSAYITGIYDYMNGNETAYIYGKYDKSISKKVKILSIPLNWLINMLVVSENAKDKYKNELDKIPPIGIDNSKASFFKISIIGNQNSKKVKVKAKILKK